MKTKKIIFLSNLLAIAIVLNLLESLIPAIGIPGVRIGLANIVVLITIMNFRFSEALSITLLRIFLVGLLKGTFLNIPFFMSLGGGILSFLMMFLIYKFAKFSVVGISIIGSLTHCLGQILVAMIVISTKDIIYYLPFMILLSIPTGVFIGFISLKLNKLKIFDSINEKDISK